MTDCKIFSYPNNHINSITFHIVCQTGAMDEKDSEQGITHLIEHLCFRKAGEFSQSQIYHFFESKGVNIFGKTGKNYIELSFSCRPDVFDDIAKLLSKMWFELDYSTDDIEIEKKIILNEIAINEPTNAEIILGKVWHNGLLDCNILGRKQTLQNITLKQIVNYKKQMLSAHTSIVLAGNFSEDNLILVQKEFVNKFVATEPSNPKFVEQINKLDKLVVVKDRYSLSDVYYSLHTIIGNSIEKYVAILTLDDLLFRGNAGYIVETMRDKFGYIYEIDSRVEIINGEVGWIIHFSCDKNDVTQAINCLEKLLNSFELSNKYLHYTKAFYCDNLPMLLDKPDVICNCIVNSIVAINKVVTLQEFAEHCQAVDPLLYKQLLEQLLTNKHVHIFGNVSYKTTQRLRKLLLQ